MPAQQPIDTAPATPSRDARDPATVDHPRISVVIASWNVAKTLQAALDSIYQQTYDNIEIVIADGGSTDGTREILERNSDLIAHWESAPDDGIYDAWNKAVAHTTGDWICFLGADDRYHTPAVMAEVAEAIVADRGAHRVIYGSIDVHRPDGSIRHSRPRQWGAEKRRRFRRGEMVPHPATFHHRTLFDDLHGFDTSFRIAGDYEFLIRVFAREVPVRMDVIVVDMASGGLSTAPEWRVRQVREVYRARHKNGIAKMPEFASPRHLRELTKTWWRWQGKPKLTGRPPV